MTNKELMAKIKAEIERLKKAQEVSEDKDYAQYELDVACGYDMACDDILSFLSAIESEKQKEVKPCHRTRKRLAEWSKTSEGRESYEKVAEEMRKQIVPNDLEGAAKKHFKQEWNENYWAFEGDVINTFIAGAKWDRQQMMKEAVEAEILLTPYPTIWLDDCKDYDFKDGQKVRVIIIKEN